MVGIFISYNDSLKKNLKSDVITSGERFNCFLRMEKMHEYLPLALLFKIKYHS